MKGISGLDRSVLSAEPPRMGHGARRRRFKSDPGGILMRCMLLAALLTLAGCGGGVNSTPQAAFQNPAATRAVPNATGSGKIDHVIYVVQEGRSFDDLFQGYPGADTTSTGEISSGKTIALQPIGLKVRYNIATSA